MITILDLTTSDAIRATLGIDVEELSDQQMEDSDVEGELELDLYGWLPNGTDLEAVIEDGKDSDPGTVDSQKYLRLTSYAKAYCSYFFTLSQDNWRLIRLTDGNIDERRRADTDLEDLKRHLLDLLNKHKLGFMDLVDEDATTGFSVMGISSPTYDPVTG